MRLLRWRQLRSWAWPCVMGGVYGEWLEAHSSVKVWEGAGPGATTRGQRRPSLRPVRERGDAYRGGGGGGDA
jgi:hypothetical protein